jgi:PTS system galactitol-specific IIA component
MTQSLRFDDLVLEDLILDDLDAGTREEALRRMAEILVQRGFCKPQFVQAILDREAAHPSGLPMPGLKIAIPHTDADHVNRSALLFARLRKAVEFRSMGSPDEKLQVGMISMFALKEKKLIGDLLETLLTVYQHEEVLAALAGAADRKAMFSILKENVQKYGKT